MFAFNQIYKISFDQPMNIEQRKNASGAISVICLCRDKRGPDCENVFWNVIFFS